MKLILEPNKMSPRQLRFMHTTANVIKHYSYSRVLQYDDFIKFLDIILDEYKKKVKR